jgi:DNA invertase Pin-like site-specific DNA recombinase
MAGKAASYLRVSGLGQVEGDGFDRQRDAIKRYAKANGLKVAAEYSDGGVSGTSDADARPGLGALLDRLEHNGIKTVLVENASRLARDLMVQEIALARFRKLGVDVIEADGGNSLTASDGNPTQKLIRQLLGAVAEFEKSVLVSKLKAARDRKRLTGKCEGRKAFGEREGEAETVKLIVKLRRKARKGPRLSFASIAQRLNDEGVPTRYGRPWRPSTVQNVVKREKAPKIYEIGLAATKNKRQ